MTPPRPQAGRLASRAQDMWLREHRAELQRIVLAEGLWPLLNTQQRWRKLGCQRFRKLTDEQRLPYLARVMEQAPARAARAKHGRFLGRPPLDMDAMTLQAFIDAAFVLAAPVGPGLGNALVGSLDQFAHYHVEFTSGGLSAQGLHVCSLQPHGPVAGYCSRLVSCWRWQHQKKGGGVP